MDALRHIRVLVPALAAFALLPASAVASDGGVGIPEEQPATDASGLVVNAKRSVWLGKAVQIGGQVPGGSNAVRLERRAPGGAWRPIGDVRSGSDGRFSTKWKPPAPGRFEVRAVLADAGGSSGPSARASSSHELLVYRPLRATWYGPGFYGNRTACGQKLTKTMKGVAHRTLPCGTKVSLSYKGREVVAEVIDRGPYANGADYDLTVATAREIGMTGTSRIGALPLRSR